MGTDKAGTIAGSTYPLDLVRSRLSIATASVDFAAARAMNVVPTSVSGRKTSVVGQATLASGFHTSSAQTAEAVASATSGAIKPKYSPKDLTMWGMTLKVMREEGGVRALYRGIGHNCRWSRTICRNQFCCIRGIERLHHTPWEDECREKAVMRGACWWV